MKKIVLICLCKQLLFCDYWDTSKQINKENGERYRDLILITFFNNFMERQRGLDSCTKVNSFFLTNKSNALGEFPICAGTRSNTLIYDFDTKQNIQTETVKFGTKLVCCNQFKKTNGDLSWLCVEGYKDWRKSDKLIHPPKTTLPVTYSHSSYELIDKSGNTTVPYTSYQTGDNLICTQQNTYAYQMIKVEP